MTMSLSGCIPSFPGYRAIDNACIANESTADPANGRAEAADVDRIFFIVRAVPGFLHVTDRFPDRICLLHGEARFGLPP